MVLLKVSICIDFTFFLLQVLRGDFFFYYYKCIYLEVPLPRANIIGLAAASNLTTQKQPKFIELKYSWERKYYKRMNNEILIDFY